MGELVSEVRNITVNGKYKVVFERSAVKDRDGFKVEANDDDDLMAMLKANDLYQAAIAHTEAHKPKPEKEK